MNALVLRTLCLSALLTCLACTNHQQVATEVTSALRAFEAAQKRRDVEGLIAFLDKEFAMINDGKRIDYASTVAQIRDTLPSLKSFKPRFEDIRVVAIGSDAALTSMIFHDEITYADGNQVSMWGPSTMLWRRTAGRWRMVFADSDHYGDGDNRD